MRADGQKRQNGERKSLIRRTCYGAAKKGLEWLAVLVCMKVGRALGIESICAAAMTYMMATELVSLMENMKLFGLDIPVLNQLLDIARRTDK